MVVEKTWKSRKNAPGSKKDEEKGPEWGAAWEIHCSQWQLFVWTTQITAGCRFQLSVLQKWASWVEELNWWEKRQPQPPGVTAGAAHEAALVGGWHSWCCANRSRDASLVLTPTLKIQHSELDTPELPAQHWDQGCATNTLGSFPGAASAASTSQFHPSSDLPVQTAAPSPKCSSGESQTLTPHHRRGHTEPAARKAGKY